MNTNEIKKMQTRINKKFGTSLVVDGVWGVKSKTACKEYLMSLMPSPNPWPSVSRLEAFYGKAGDESNLEVIEFPYPMIYDGKPVKKTRVNKKCSASLVKVLKAIKKRMEEAPDIKGAAEDYGGVFNFRLKRGGSSYSLHAYGAAIDLDADDNTFKQTWPEQADMPLEIIEEFAKEGWISAAAFWGYDAMHFQATR